MHDRRKVADLLGQRTDLFARTVQGKGDQVDRRSVAPEELLGKQISRGRQRDFQAQSLRVPDQPAGVSTLEGISAGEDDSLHAEVLDSVDDPPGCSGLECRNLLRPPAVRTFLGTFAGNVKVNRNRLRLCAARTRSHIPTVWQNPREVYLALTSKGALSEFSTMSRLSAQVGQSAPIENRCAAHQIRWGWTMATVALVEYDAAIPAVRQVYDDIMTTRKTDWINNFWKALAVH